MRVALVELALSDSIAPGFNEFEEPLGLCYVGAAALQEGHTIRLFQQTFESDGQILESVKRFAPELVGFTAVTSVFARACKFATNLKRFHQDIVTVIGGSHACAASKQCAAHFDYVVVGEGERTFCSLLSSLSNGKEPSSGGLCFMRAGNPAFTGYPKRIWDLNALMPMRDGLPMAAYDPSGSPPVPFGTTGFAAIVTSRGCRYACGFCSNGSIWLDGCSERVPVVFRSPANILEELCYLHETRGVNYVVVEDTDFLSRPRKDVFAFAEMMARNCPNVKWACLARHDRILRRWPASDSEFADARQLLQAMKRAGCHLICLGVESGDGAMRRRMGKPSNDESVLAVFDMMYDARILSAAFFVLGYPGESHESLQKTREFALRLNTIRLRFSFFYPFGGVPCLGQESVEWLAPNLSAPEHATTERPTVRCDVPADALVTFKRELLSEFYDSSSYESRLDAIANWSEPWARTMKDWRQQLAQLVARAVPEESGSAETHTILTQ